MNVFRAFLKDNAYIIMLRDCVAVSCPPGTYTNRSACVPCEEGEYQDEAGQLECKPCPDGTTTPFTEATSVTDCTGKSKKV